MKLKVLILFLSFSFLISCKKDEENFETLFILSSTINGITLVDDLKNVETEVEISIVFSSAVDTEKLKSALTLKTSSGDAVTLNFSFSNAQSKVTIISSLNYNTVYLLEIAENVIGKNGEKLEASFEVSFETLEDGTVRSLSPCTSTVDCLQTNTFTVGGQDADFSYYSSYPIFLEDAQWEKLKYALIVIHGQNREAGLYFSYLTAALSAIGSEDSTVLLAPFFKASAGVANEMYWPTTNSWREGQNSGGDVKLSSFAVIDSLIAQLTNKDRFPVLEKIIITGHSSGGLFVHLYAGSNGTENLYHTVDFEYIVANSQYFYYTSDYRYDENADGFFEPQDCIGFNYWPYGYNSTPPYLNGISVNEFNSQFISRKIIYLLGNGIASDGTLNTSDCAAVLLGSSRYKRGENMYRFMDTYHTGHTHSKVVVEGIGHDGERMYKSQEFISLLSDLLK